MTLKHNKAVLFANGDFPCPERLLNQIADGDFLVAVDGGLSHMTRHGLSPDLIIGDLDSANPDDVSRFKAQGVDIRKFPREKNETDLELALAAVLEMSFHTIWITAAFGKRLDQTLGNIFLLSSDDLANCDIRLIDGQQEVFLIRQSASITGEPGQRVSLLPFNIMKHSYSLLILLILSSMLAGCVNDTSSDEARILTVMTHDSFAISEDLIAEFESEHDIKVSFVRSGDAGRALNQAILSKENPIADIFYGVDNTFLTRALQENIFEAYASPLLSEIPDNYQIDPDNFALPVDYGDVCINYDRSFFEESNLEIPATLEVLTEPEYAGLLVTENPATSSPGLAFLMATIAQYGEENYLNYWMALKENDLVVVSDWETAYYTNFSGSTGQGPQPMVVSYSSSPAAEVIFAESELEKAPTASIVGPNTCYRQVEFVGILRGTENRDMAEDFIDFMLSVPFQEDIPMQMFVYPVNQNAALPQAFVENVQIPDEPASLSPQMIDQNREKWIKAWTDLVLD